MSELGPNETWVFRVDRPSTLVRSVIRVVDVELGKAIANMPDRCFPIDENNTTYWADVDELFDALVNDPDIVKHVWDDQEVGKKQARLLLGAMDNLSLKKVDVVHFHIP